MSASEQQVLVLGFLRGEFLREKETGFATFRRIPSTAVRQFIDYFGSLSHSGQRALSDALAEVALNVFFPSAPHPGQSGNIAYKSYVDALPLMWDWRYCGTRIARMLLAEAERAPEYSRHVRGMSAEAVEAIRAIRPVKAPEIRRVVKLAMTQLFGDVSVSHGGGCWDYSGAYTGMTVCVGIDYGGRSDQLRYEISLGDASRGLQLRGLSYERLMGLSFAHWDCLEQSNLDQSVGLLKELCLYCINMPGRLPGAFPRCTSG